ncbi:MAG: hypothetical protein ACR2QM_17380 [Longimicrobiales bacterium]
MRIAIAALALVLWLPAGLAGQEGAAEADSVTQEDPTTAQGGIYDRPFIGSGGGTSLGGYVEGNTNYFVEDGISEGFSMELRRFNIFLFSQVSRRVRFISELEFEHGTEEIALETALVDVQVNPYLTVRAGIILPPLGYLNQNHDSPKWEFIERPFVSTDVIPSTLSEVGAGVFGRAFAGPLTVTYDAYVTNGLAEGVLDNDLGRTDIASGKSEEAFGEDNNASPAISGRLAARHRRFGEVGLSYYGGNYNRFRLEGEEVDDRRWLGIVALDVGAEVGPVQLRGEAARATIDVPPGLAEVFGDTQWAAHLDAVATVWRPAILGYDNAAFNVALRIERIDYNVGSFSSTEQEIQDDITALVPGISFRPSPGTVFRANYRRHWTRDFVGNPTVRLGGWQLGFATYF